MWGPRLDQRQDEGCRASIAGAGQIQGQNQGFRVRGAGHPVAAEQTRPLCVQTGHVDMGSGFISLTVQAGQDFLGVSRTTAFAGA